MKKTKAFISMGAITLLAIASMIALPSCSKDGFKFGKGRAVQFKTSSSGAVTKTSYGADGAHANGKVAIPWEAGDVIRIASDRATVSMNAQSSGYGNYYADYTVKPNADDPSNATVMNYDTDGDGAVYDSSAGDLAGQTSDENGLAWDDNEEGDYTFYAVYPSPVNKTDKEGFVVGLDLDADKKKPTGTVTATIPSAQTVTAAAEKKTYTAGEGDAAVTYSYTAYEPDMDYAFMTAKKTVEANTTVPLTFYPAFTAIEINLSSADDEFNVKGMSLTSESDALAGNFTVAAGTDFDQAGATAPTINDETLIKEVSASFGDGVIVTPVKDGKSDGVTTTLFLLPVTNTGVITLNVTVAEGTSTTVAKLQLVNKDKTAYKFLAGKKYRINLLKIGGKFNYSIALAENALPWYDFEHETSYSDNVQSGPFKIKGSEEGDSNAYEAYDTGTNNAFVSYKIFEEYTDEQKTSYTEAHPTYAYRYYQQRTLLMKDITNPYFEFTFKPNAPLAGYWNLVPEAAPSYGVTGQGGTEGFKIYLVKTDSDGEVEDPNAWSSGQIMGADVKIRIYPDPNRDKSKQYVMLFKTYFSPNKSGDPAYSADSETQDAHGDGTFSYWKFIIPATE
ncbi:MAG: fimbrillin family protein [Bacteroidales bacterium]|nr:fimbrillin family protein [Bacteroidales bacterium]